MDTIKKHLFLSFFLVFLIPAGAENNRDIALDMFLIIDSSQAMETPKNEVISWLNDRVIDEILINGDSITVWAAGERAEIIYSDTISTDTSKSELRERIRNLNTDGRAADFTGALRELEPRVSGVPQDRLAYSMLITSSAEGLVPLLTGTAQQIFRWSRSERYERWQVFIFAPDIGPRVQQAASAFLGAR